MLDSLKTDTPATIRGKAVLELAYSSALRTREVRNLKLGHIDYQKGMLFIEQSKNLKDRMVPAGRIALESVGRYIGEVRCTFGWQDGESLSLGRNQYRRYIFSNGSCPVFCIFCVCQ